MIHKTVVLCILVIILAIFETSQSQDIELITKNDNFLLKDIKLLFKDKSCRNKSILFHLSTEEGY